MNSEAFIDKDFFPRPKVNRLPLPLMYEMSPDGKSSDNHVIWQSIYAFGIMALLVIFFIAYQYSVGLSKNAVIAPDDKHLMTLVNSSDDFVEISDTGLYFKDSGGVIVGQMVKITPSLDKNAVSSTFNNDDVDSRRELLAILSKY